MGGPSCRYATGEVNWEMPQIICLRSSAIICRICVIWGVFQVSRRKSCKQFLNMWGAARQQQQHVETTSDHNSAAGLSGCLIIVWWKHNSVEVSTFNLDIYDTWTKSDINFLLKLCILALKDFLHSPLTQLTYSKRSTMARQFISNWKWDEIFFGESLLLIVHLKWTSFHENGEVQ